MFLDGGHVMPLLPKVLYSSVIPNNRPTWGFYIVLVVCAAVWAVTPLS